MKANWRRLDLEETQQVQQESSESRTVEKIIEEPKEETLQCKDEDKELQELEANHKDHKATGKAL